MVRIRRYQKEDYEQFRENLKEADLFDEAWDSEENINKIVAFDKNSILIAEEDGKLVGTILVLHYGSKIQYFDRLVVKKDYREKGIATKLIKKVTKIAKENGVTELGLYVDSKSGCLDHFYKKRNFKKSTSAYYYMWKKI